MGFDSRHLVLEFLADNRNLGIQQMTLVFFGKKRDPFLQQCINSSIDKVFVYHNKGTRLFWKEYEYDKLSGTIIELLFDTNDSLNISKNEINFSIKEPYYFLDLQQFDFKYLSAIAVKEEDELIGYALLYGDRLIIKDEYPQVALKRLYRNIVKNENQAKFKEFDEILNNKFGYLKFESSIYVSDILSKYLNIDKKYELDYESFSELLLKTDFQEVEIQKHDEYFVHLLELNKVKVNTIDEIKYQVYDEFTLFCLKYNGIDKLDSLELLDLIKEKIVLVFPNRKYSIYKVNDNSIIILFTIKMLKKDINLLKSKLKNFSVIDIRSTVEVPKKIDLVKLSNYLASTNVKVFNYEEYQDYRKQLNTNIYLNEDKTKKIVNFSNNKVLGVYYQNELRENLNLETKKYNCFKIELDKLDDNYISLLTNIVKSTKIILVCYISNLNIDYYKEKINKLKQLGISLLASSSIFMNLKYWDLVVDLKGIFLDEDEINKLDGNQVNLIIDMYLKQSKLIFINNECLNKDVAVSNNIYKIV